MAEPRRRVLALAGASLLAGALLQAAPADAAVGDWELRTRVVPQDSHCSFPGPERVWRSLGPADLRLNKRSADVTFRKFTQAVGEPQEIESVGGSAVRSSYTGPHAGMFTFLNFGGEDRRGKQRLQFGTLTGRKWVTEKGVRVGSTLTRIKNRYGDQAWRVDDHPGRSGHWWRLAGYCGHPLFDGPLNIIEARVKHGVVVKFYLWIGAAGD